MHIHIYIYTCIYMQNESQCHNNNGRAKTFRKYIPLNLFARFERVVWGFTVRGSWRPNGTAIYCPPLLWPSTLCLSRSPDAQPEAQGPSSLLDDGFLCCILSATGLVPNSSGAPRSPSAWCGFPYHTLSATYLQL